MNKDNLLKNLCVPKGEIDVVFDSDTYNEMDDQFALVYLLKSKEKLHLKALYAAPYYNSRSSSPADGMEKSYREQLRILELTGNSELKSVTFRGSEKYLPDEKTPVISDAANDLAKRAMEYSPEKPLYVIAIGAITNIASALLINPEIADRIVVVWLGGHALHIEETGEFNMVQDIAAARVVMLHAPVVQLPCAGVVDRFHFSVYDFEHYLKGKNEICDYLYKTAMENAPDEEYLKTHAYSKVVWDVTAVGYLLNDGDRFMKSRIVPLHIPTYDKHYREEFSGLMGYVYRINVEALATDLFGKVSC